VLGVLTSLLLFFSSDLHRILSDPYKRVLGEKAMFFPIKLMGPFMIYLQASFVVALIASLPIILYFFWGFIVPAVSHEIEKSGKLVIIVSSLLFWAGVALCWFRIFESILYFFLVYINPPDVRQELPLDEYYSIFFMIHLLFGLAFQLPIVVVILGRLGIVHSSFFISRWRESTMVVAVISVLIGPEIISSLILFGCLMVLFIGSVVFIRVAEKKEI
jgi:sec-independent protein translocase protein TatC